jgi:predicted component of type VI protein secretion system
VRSKKVAGVLVSIEGKLESRVFRVFEGENLLGRDRTGCQDPFPDRDAGDQADASISRRHCTIVCEGGLFAIRPEKAENPVFLNGSETQGDELRHGDRISLGKSTFVFLAVPSS